MKCLRRGLQLADPAAQKYLFADLSDPWVLLRMLRVVDSRNSRDEKEFYLWCCDLVKRRQLPYLKFGRIGHLNFFFKFVIGCWYTVLGIVLAFILLIGIGGSVTAGNSGPFLIMSGMAAEECMVPAVSLPTRPPMVVLAMVLSILEAAVQL